MPKLNAAQRSLTYLRKQGYTAEVTERFVTFGGTRAQDEYIAELVRQRAELIHHLQHSISGYVTNYESEELLDGLAEPQPPPGVGGYTKDLFGFGDIFAFDDHHSLIAQTTSRARISVHLLAYRRDEQVSALIRRYITHALREFVVHGWERVQVAKKTGKGMKWQWQLTERWVEIEDLELTKRDVAAMAKETAP